MRRSIVSVCLSLFILALFVAAGSWLLERSGREPATGERPREAGVSIDGGRAPGAGLATGAAERGPDREAAGSEPPEAAFEKSGDASELPVSIEGKVTDASGSGVAGARVAAVERKALADILEKDRKRLDREPLQALRAFRSSLGDLAKRLPSCETAADGTYALRGLPDGEHRVIVTHSEFLTHGEEDWILVEAGTKARYDVELVMGQVIAGIVRDKEGRPVSGARARVTPIETARLKGLGKIVQVFIDQTEAAALLEAGPSETDSLGAFRVTSLEPGVYDLRVVKEGYAWGEARGVPSGTEDVQIALEPAIRVTGRVVSPAGKAIAGASVVLREPERDFRGPAGPMAVAFVDVDVIGEKERIAATGEDGRFALEAFSRGAYDLAVGAEGFPEHSRTLALEGAALELGDIVLAEGLDIAGTVLAPDGQPVDGAQVWVPKPADSRQDRDSRRISVMEAGLSWSIARSQSDRHGTFRLTGLGGGSHEVAVLAEGYPGSLLESVAAGSRGVMVALERGLTVRGIVVDAETGEPVPGARVDVVWDPNVKESGEDGRFELRGVRRQGVETFGGTVAVRAAREGFHEAQETIVFPDPGVDPVVETRLELRRFGADDPESGIPGVVRGAGGEPLADARVWVEVPGWPRAFLRMVAGDRAREVRTGADGTFLLPAPGIGGMRFEILASYPGLAASRAGPFAPDQGAKILSFVEIRLGEGAAIEGRVTSLSGAPVSGARVRVWRDSQVPEEATVFSRLLPQSEGQATYSAKDGTYRLRRIEAGSYWIEARAQGYAVKTIGPVEVRPGGAALEGEGPAAGGAPTRVDIALGSGGSLEGRVVDPEESPLAGIEVVALPVVETSGPYPADTAPDEDDDLFVTGALGAAAVTGADGAYRIDHLPEGRFRVLARARGFEPAMIPAATPGQPLPDLVLALHSRIIGRVKDAATGAPVTGFAVRFDRREADGSFREDNQKARDVVDAEGRFACEGLRAGDWRVHVLSKEYSTWRKAVSLAPGQEVELDVALTEGRRIEGAVRRPDGAPIAGATISASLEGEAPGGERRHVEPALSADDGGFAFAGLEPGSYRVQASHPDYYAEGPEGTAKAQVTAAEDSTVALVLRPAGKIRGRIRGLVLRPPGMDFWIVHFSPVAADPSEGGARRRPAARGEQGAGAPAPGRAFQAHADESGTFSADSVCPGKYRVELTHRRRAPDTGDEWINVPPDRQPLGEVEIRAGELASFEGEAP